MTLRRCPKEYYLLTHLLAMNVPFKFEHPTLGCEVIIKKLSRQTTNTHLEIIYWDTVMIKSFWSCKALFNDTLTSNIVLVV